MSKLYILIIGIISLCLWSCQRDKYEANTYLKCEIIHCTNKQDRASTTSHNSTDNDKHHRFVNEISKEYAFVQAMGYIIYLMGASPEVSTRMKLDAETICSVITGTVITLAIGGVLYYYWYDAFAQPNNCLAFQSLKEQLNTSCEIYLQEMVKQNIINPKTYRVRQKEYTCLQQYQNYTNTLENCIRSNTRGLSQLIPWAVFFASGVGAAYATRSIVNWLQKGCRKKSTIANPQIEALNRLQSKVISAYNKIHIAAKAADHYSENLNQEVKQLRKDLEKLSEQLSTVLNHLDEQKIYVSPCCIDAVIKLYHACQKVDGASLEHNQVLDACHDNLGSLLSGIGLHSQTKTVNRCITRL